MIDEMSDAVRDETAIRWNMIEGYLKTHSFIVSADGRDLCCVSTATENRILVKFAEGGKLAEYRESGHWAYRASK